MKKISTVTAILLIAAAILFVLSQGGLNAQGANADSDIISKLDEIAKSQQDLLAAVNAIKEDLKIIKLRITQMQ